jgi:hypothetical protein
MKKFLPTLFLLLIGGSTSYSHLACKKAESGSPQEEVDACQVYGEIKFVEYDADYQVEFVENLEDLRVEYVEHFPDEEGKWEVVEHHEDYRIEVVEHHEDFEVKEVEHFPGCD